MSTEQILGAIMIIVLVGGIIAAFHLRRPGPPGPPGPIGPKGDVGYGIPGPMGKCECKEKADLA